MTTATTANARTIGLSDVRDVESSTEMHIQTKLNTLRVFSAFYDQPDVSQAAQAAIERLQTAQRISINSSDRENGDSIYFRLNEKATAAGWRNWSYHHLKNSTWVAYPLPE
jgi:hypothetical protein